MDPQSNALLTVPLGSAHSYLRPKLKFYLFPLTQPTLKKGPTQKFLIQFSVKNIFFKFHCNLRELSNVNSVILVNCLCIPESILQYF